MTAVGRQIYPRRPRRTEAHSVTLTVSLTRTLSAARLRLLVAALRLPASGRATGRAAGESEYSSPRLSSDRSLSDHFIIL
jgi:hypothetical protein